MLQLAASCLDVTVNAAAAAIAVDVVNAAHAAATEQDWQHVHTQQSWQRCPPARHHHLFTLLPCSIHCLSLPSQDLKPEDYTYHLTEADVAETIAAADAILARGVKDEEDIKKVGRQTATKAT